MELEKRLAGEPVFCFGTDTDWHSDQCIEQLLACFEKNRAKLTLFATDAAAMGAARRRFVEMAVHPNFLPGSTHGSTVDEVIRHVFDLVPDAKTYRSHSYFDHQRITEKMAERGIRYDANLCLYRQAGLGPLRHCHIDWRFPSWLDDNVHWYHKGSWRLSDLKQELEQPGLKIINVHPATFALNLPNLSAYQQHRGEFATAGRAYIERHRYGEHGPGTWLAELLDWLVSRHPTFHLSELYELHTLARGPSVDPRLVGSAATTDVEGRPPVEGDYASADDERRMAMVRAQYDRFSATGRYATSRDYNNRELEIAGIRGNLTGQRVLDLGCGNGYTLLALGTELESGRLVGVDFSQSMVDGARELMRTEYEGTLKVQPEFVCSDVFAFLEAVDVGEFDTIISERLVLNLPSWEKQRKLIEAIIARLSPGGRYLMVEASAQGFGELNAVRRRCGLAEIPDRYPGNESSNKLDEENLKGLFAEHADVQVRPLHYFSFYALASKVLHPLLVAPNEPKFTAPINDFARMVQQALTDAGIALPNLGASKMWTVEKRAR
jgi:SAM-dependent methyltransferase